MLGGRPTGAFGKRSTPVMHALLEDVPIKCAIVVHAKIQVLEHAIQIRSINKSNKS